MLRFSRDTRDVTCRLDQRRAEAAQAIYRSAVARVLAALPKAEVIDPFPTFCDGKFCYGVRDGAILYSDKDHLSVKGSLLLTGLFRTRLDLK